MSGRSASKTERKLLMPGGLNTKYASGFLTFVRAGTLMAQPFDAKRLTLSGEAVPIAEQVFTGMAVSTGAFSISDTGVLAVRNGTIGGRSFAIGVGRS